MNEAESYRDDSLHNIIDDPDPLLTILRRELDQANQFNIYQWLILRNVLIPAAE